MKPGGDGILRDGPGRGLPACVTATLEDDWGHFAPGKPLAAPRYTPDKLRQLLSGSLAVGQVPMLNGVIDQEGHLSPATVALLRAAAPPR